MYWHAPTDVRRAVLLLSLALLLAACGAEGGTGEEVPPPPPPVPAGAAPPRVELVDTAIVPAAAGEEGWHYSQAVEADLDGDGRPERVVLAARVELYRGRPAWDDGQPWQVYVEEAHGARTRLYVRYVQLGTVAMRVGLAEGGRPASVVLVEHLPDRLAVYEVEYRGPGDAVVAEHFVRALDPTGEVAGPALP